MITLYHNKMSTCAQKVRFALCTKNLEWSGEELDLRRGDQLRPEYLAINPKGLVPALVHDGHVIVESNIILDYLDETFPDPPLMPVAPLHRARIRWWMKKLDDGLHLDVAALSFGIAFRHQLVKAKGSRAAVEAHIAAIPDPYLRDVQRQVVLDGVDSPRFATAILQFEKLLADLDETLSSQTWLGGDHLSIADIAFAPYVTRLEHLHLEHLWDDLKHFSEWQQRLFQTDGYQAGLVQWFDHDFVGLMRAKGAEARAATDRILATR